MFTQEETLRRSSDLSQHRSYPCFELIGKSFMLEFDDGRSFFLKPLSEEVALFGEIGKAPTLEHYRCLKGSARVYFLHLDLKVRPVYNISFILDEEERLVTMVEPHQYAPEKFPHWFADDITFGYINVCGYPVPEKRHAYTKDLVGNKIEWHYCSRDKVTHLYVSDSKIMLAHVPPEQMSEAERAVHQRMLDNGTEPFEEPAAYIKIKEDLYLVCFCEANMSHKILQKGGGGILLMDMKRIMDVGIFLDIDENGDAMFTLVSADGTFKYESFYEESLPSAYDRYYSIDGKSCVLKDGTKAE